MERETLGKHSSAGYSCVQPCPKKNRGTWVNVGSSWALMGLCSCLLVVSGWKVVVLWGAGELFCFERQKL